MTTPAAPETPGGVTPAVRPVHVVMVVENDVAADTRVRKEASSLAEAGHRVTVVGLAAEGLPLHEQIGQAVIQRVDVPRRVLEAWVGGRKFRRSLRPRVVAYRNPRAALAAKARVTARLRDVQAESGRALRARREGRLGATPFKIGVARRRVRRIALTARSRNVDFRAGVTRRLNRWFTNGWKKWDARSAQRERGVNWRRDNPGLDDFELAFGPVIDRLQPDVVHAQDVFSIGVAARAVARSQLAGRPTLFVYDAHEFVPGLPKGSSRAPRFAAAIESIEREYVHDADRIITVSPVIADAIQAHYRLDRRPDVVLNAPVVDGGPPPEPSPELSVRAAAGVADSVPLLVYSGGMKKVRGVDTAIRALASLPGVHLAVVCVPHSQTVVVNGLRVDAEQAGVADRAHFVDPVGSDDVVAFLSTADIGVHPMHGGIPNHEMALPNKLFEYLHAGLPLVVTDLQVLGAFVREHGIGQTFPSEDAEGLAAAVSKVLDDLPSYQQAVSDPELRATFTWERQADVLRQVYDELLALR